jgi:hypothetical protein
VLPVAPTVMTPPQFAGEKFSTSKDSLPADATTTAPCASASSTASWTACEHAPKPPRLMLTTRAGFGFGGTPAIATPDAHSMPSKTSASVPPHFASARTGRILAAQSMPAMPVPLSVFAAMRPETNRPW